MRINSVLTSGKTHTALDFSPLSLAGTCIKHWFDITLCVFLFTLLEPLQYPLISSPSFFCKHASTLINAVQDGFIAIGKEVPGKNFIIE